MDLLEMLVGACEALITSGHNQPHLDPYTYPIKKLLELNRIRRKRLHTELSADSMLHHASRIATVSGEAQLYNDLISNLQ